MVFSSCCPGCDATIIGGSMLFLFLALKILESEVGEKIPKWVKTTLKITTYMSGGGIICFAILLGILERDADLRAWAFSKLCASMTKSPAMNEARCNLLGNIKGTVVEFGTGPGTNFKCWSPPNGLNITTYIGVEPNKYFKPFIKQEKTLTKLSFEPMMLWEQGGSTIHDIFDSSVDAVVATHLLCSVGDDDVVDSILNEISRILKRGGKFYFLEHVSAADKTLMKFMQESLAPLFRIVGNGCQFKPIWRNLERFAKDKGLELQLTHWNAPMSVPFLKPHIIGSITKL
jgi:SAM-dependent methyltransferase